MRSHLVGTIVLTALFVIAALAPVRLFGQQSDPSIASVLELNARIAQKKSAIASLRGQIAAYVQKIKQKQSEKVSLENQLSLIDDHITTTELDLNATQSEIDQLALEIEQATLEIQEKELRISNGKQRLASLIRSLYQETDTSPLEILLMHDRFSDFFDQIRSLELMQSDVRDSVQQVKGLHEQLLAQRASMEHVLTRQEELKKNLERDNEQLGEQKEAKEQLITQSILSTEKYQSLLSQARSEQQQVDAAIANLELSLRKKLSIFDDKQAALAWPIDPIRGISAYFHDPSYPFRAAFEHPAIDIRASQGSTIKSAEDGYVARVKFDGSRAYAYVMIIHASGLATVYGHISRPMVSQDTYVKKGQVIALSGATPGTAGAGPLTTGPHLHFEVRKSGIPVDPLKYLP